MSILDNYTGSKAASGVFQVIINHIPPHKIYAEPCAGTTAIYERIRKPKEAWLGDLSTDVAEALELRFPDANVRNKDWFDLMCDLIVRTESLRSPKELFLYFDPPCPMETRRPDRRRYEHEMSRSEHREILATITKLSCRVMISTYKNDLYASWLKDWHSCEFNAMTRHGRAHEVIYMNYDIRKTGLHDYQYFGNDFRHRELVRGRQDSLVRKLERLRESDELELLAALSRIKSTYSKELKKL